MQNSLTIQSSINTDFFNKISKFLIFITIVVSISIPIYYTINKPTDFPTDFPTDTSIDTDIDWTKPPCNPEDLSNDWKEITNSNMKNRRVFVYKETNIQIAFDKGIRGAPRFKGIDHWHRFNPNSTNNKDMYLDKNGNPTGKNTNPSHIKPCK